MRALRLERARRLRIAAFLLVLAALVLPLSGLPAVAQTSLKIFTGSAQRAESMRPALEAYTRQNPAIRIEIETGGATLEQQQLFLASMIGAKDPSVDLVLIDVIRLAQWAASQWAEPLDSHLGAEKGAVLARYPAAFREAASHEGRLFALPYEADALFLYYRKDLLEKYGLAPPRSWDELKAAALKVLAGENNPALRGLAITGAPVESALCTYFLPFWGLGEEFTRDGRPNLAGEAARRPFQLYADLREAKAAPNLAEIGTDRVRLDMQAGNLVFGIGWGYAYGRFENDPNSAMRGRIGIAPPPGMAAEHPVSCLGGWQVAVSAFSANKAEAVRLARFLASPEAGKLMALAAPHLPAATELYADADLLREKPWLAQVLPALQAARARPIHPRFAEISDILRPNISAALAGTKTPEAALAEINARLALILR